MFHKVALRVKQKRDWTVRKLQDQVCERLRRWNQGHYKSLWEEAVTEQEKQNERIRRPFPQEGGQRRSGRLVQQEVVAQVDGYKFNKAKELIRNGRIADAMESLTNEPPADHRREEVRAKILKKFPQTLHEENDTPAPPAGQQRIVVTQMEVRDAILETKKGLVAGPTGFSVDLAKIAVHTAKWMEHVPFLEAFANIVQNIANGETSENLREVCTMAYIFPVGEKARPIAVDDFLVKIVSKILAKTAKNGDKLPLDMRLYQMAFMRNGTERIFQAVRKGHENKPEGLSKHHWSCTVNF